MFKIQFEKKMQDDRLCMGHFSIWSGGTVFGGDRIRSDTSVIEMSTLLLDGVIARASERLGYSALRPNQYKAIKSFLEGKDAFVTLPTESAKSLCYAIFAFDDMYSHVGSIALIVSPLKALMKDQHCATAFSMQSCAESAYQPYADEYH